MFFKPMSVHLQVQRFSSITTRSTPLWSISYQSARCDRLRSCCLTVVQACCVRSLVALILVLIFYGKSTTHLFCLEMYCNLALVTAHTLLRGTAG